MALSTAIESASHERDLIELAYLDGTITEAEFGQVSALIAQQGQSLQDFQRSAPIQLYVSLDGELQAADNVQLTKSRGHLSAFLKGRAPDFEASVAWQKAANPRIVSMVATEGKLVADIARVATNIENSERLKAGIFGAGAFFGLVLAILLAFVLAQRITRPLRRLTLAAAEIGEELPHMVERMQTPGEGPGVIVDPIPVEGNDEIGRLAAAFNTVNEVTLRVAKEQAALRASIAEMFVNVARRNQVLLGRQLAQLDKMESREENPDLLKNLFRLDHLATRMRRNAESLLVLAGIDSTRRLRESMPLSDVIRAAVGEIEAYERIDSSVADDPDVSGRHALSVAHLLAEVLENATVFSNPDTRVVVASAMTGHGVDVTITDYGLGMSDEEIAQANESIANPPLAEIAVSQRLGLFVVGRIAARLGATATLRKGRTSGTVVTIGLPLDIFEGLQVDEPVTSDQPVETSETTDSVVTESLLDEPIREDVLVGSVPQFASAAAPLADAPAAEAPLAAVALFNPSEVALSRLPQVDVAALVADAAADVHFASPASTDTSRRRLLPRRSRSDEPDGPAVVAPDDDAAEADAPVDEVVADVVPVDAFPVVPATELPEFALPDAEAPDAVVADAELADAELADAELADAELADEVAPEIVASARRRGSFFPRRRDKSAEPADTTEPTDEAPLDVAVAGTAADVDDIAVHQDLEEQTPRAEWQVAEGVLDDAEVVSDVSTDGDAPAEEAAGVVPTPRRSRRRSGRTRRNQQAVEATNLESAAEQLVVEEPSVAEEPAAYQPVSFEPAASEPVASAPEPYEPPSYVPDTFEPVAVATPELVADEAAVAEPIRRRGLFGRRQWVADKHVPEESVAETVASLPVAEETDFLPAAEAVVESDVAAPAAEELFTPVFDTGPPQFAWPVADEPVAVEPVVVEPVAVEPVVVEPVVVDSIVVAPTVDEPVAFEAFPLEPRETDVEQVTVDDAVADEPVAAELAAEPVVDEPIVDVVAEEPARRRGLFGRRQRGAAEPVAVEEPPSEPVEVDAPAELEVAFAPITEAPVREPFPSPSPEPQPEPAPAATQYYAPAIDILPGKAMGRRRKASIPVPSNAIAATPAAPVSTYAPSAPVVPDVAPPVAAPQFVAPLPERGFTPAAPSAPPRQAAAPASAPVPVEASPFEQVAVEPPVFEPAAAEPSLFDYATKEVEQPVVSATMSDLDQLALNAELQSECTLRAARPLRAGVQPELGTGCRGAGRPDPPPASRGRGTRRGRTEIRAVALPRRS